ncbi:hypothetical protein J6590_060173 [Homalodisca vitripennis]|nr:hypothetical protein J6590_060173 [Homalodisca vitripennis]
MYDSSSQEQTTYSRFQERKYSDDTCLEVRESADQAFPSLTLHIPAIGQRVLSVCLSTPPSYAMDTTLFNNINTKSPNISRTRLINRADGHKQRGQDIIFPGYSPTAGKEKGDVNTATAMGEEGLNVTGTINIRERRLLTYIQPPPPLPLPLHPLLPGCIGDECISSSYCTVPLCLCSRVAQ